MMVRPQEQTIIKFLTLETLICFGDIPITSASIDDYLSILNLSQTRKSQVNFVYNNVTFQVCSNSKITNKKSTYNEMDDDRLKEIEFEERNFQDQ